jgi:hypothetical protein
MLAGRWVLVILMVLLGPLLWWTGVSDTAATAHAAAAPGDADGHYFIANYDGPGRAVAGFFAFINLVLLGVLMPTIRHLRTNRTGTYARAIVTALLAIGLAWFEYVANPVTTNWGGDPDAWSMVQDHIVPWYGSLAGIWIVLVVATGTTIAGSALTAAISAHRARAQPPVVEVDNDLG